MTKVNETVFSLSFQTARGRFLFDFPKWYNVGAFIRQHAGYIPMTATRAVKIKVHSADDARMFIDYLFETSGMQPGMVFATTPPSGAWMGRKKRESVDVKYESICIDFV